jgi:hypothetical protein
VSVSALPLPQPTPFPQYIDVSPDLARTWLSTNSNNRNLRKKLVDQYARDISEGRWLDTGEAIKFSMSGQLLDGQHRLHAIAKGTQTVRLLVVTGLPDAAMVAIDSGAKRTAADAMRLLGHKNTNALTSIARIALSVERGGYAALHGKAPLSHGEIDAWVSANPTVFGAAELAVSVSRDMDCRPAIVGYAAFRTLAIDPFATAAFFDAAAGRGTTYPGHPALALSKRMADARRTREVIPAAGLLSAIFRCWNAYRAGSEVRALKINSTAGGLIPVPEPK